MNRKTTVAAFALLAPLPLMAEDLTLAISNIRSSSGIVYWSVYDGAGHYEASEDAVASGGSRAAGGDLRITLHSLPPGTYAARVYHDENSNGELDSNMLGIPTEGYGFSNNAGARGPASFDDAAIAVEGDTIMAIRMR